MPTQLIYVCMSTLLQELRRFEQSVNFRLQYAVMGESKPSKALIIKVLPYDEFQKLDMETNKMATAAYLDPDIKDDCDVIGHIVKTSPDFRCTEAYFKTLFTSDGRNMLATPKFVDEVTPKLLQARKEEKARKKAEKKQHRMAATVAAKSCTENDEVKPHTEGAGPVPKSKKEREKRRRQAQRKAENTEALQEFLDIWTAIEPDTAEGA